MADEQKPTEVIQADVDVAEPFRRGRGGKYDRDQQALVQGFADYRHRISHAAPVPREPTAGDMAAFGASEAAPYHYPGEGQQADRAAFCAGAAWIVSSRNNQDAAPAAPRMSGDLVERLRTQASMSWHSKADETIYGAAADRIESDAALIRRLVEALGHAREHIEAMTKDIGNRSYLAEELNAPDPWKDTDAGKYDGTWASYIDEIDQALAAAKLGEGRS